MEKKNYDGYYLLSLIAEDADLVSYRPKLVKPLGGILEAIFLTKVIQLAVKNNHKPFYMFNAPSPKNPSYKEGCSWQESLGFSRFEVERCLKKLGHKIIKGGEVDTDKYIWYYTDGNRVSWYKINITKIVEDLRVIYIDDAMKLVAEETKIKNDIFNQAEAKSEAKIDKEQKKETHKEIHNLYKEVVPNCKLTAKVEKAIDSFLKEGYTIDDFRLGFEKYKKLLYDKDGSGKKKYFRSYVFDFYTFVSSQKGVRRMIETDLDGYISKDEFGKPSENLRNKITVDHSHYSGTTTYI